VTEKSNEPYRNAPTMAKKLYYQDELTSEWKEGLEASIKVGKLRNHSGGFELPL
jgi:hypothetical protein